MSRRPIAAMDDMLYGSGGDNAQSGKGRHIQKCQLANDLKDFW